MPKIESSTRPVGPMPNAANIPLIAFMKTYCKHSRITEPAFVRDCIEKFLKGKRSRRDVNEFLSRQSDLDSLSRR